MDARLRHLAACAAERHGIFTTAEARAAGVSDAWRAQLVSRHVIAHVGTTTFCFAGAPMPWRGLLTAGLSDLAPSGLVTGRAGASLLGLDGFAPGAVEFLVPFANRHRKTVGVVHTSRLRVSAADQLVVETFAVVAASRLILDGTRYGWRERELEDAVDSAIRLGWTSPAYLRQRFAAARGPGLAGAARLERVLGVSGVESRLERDLVRLVRRAGLPEPELQVVHRDGGRTIARVDCRFGRVIVEVAGHGTHATRRQRQRDAQRHTELTLAGFQVLTFTYEDMRDRPGWVVAQLRRALGCTAA
jgi:very-short-patch-repair endonuclease